jgi:hypothetical protein
MRKLILEILARCPTGLGLHKAAIITELTRTMERVAGGGDVAAELAALIERRFVEAVADEITGDTIFIATAKGRAALR